MTQLNTFYQLHPHTRVLTSEASPDNMILLHLMSGLWIQMPRVQYQYIQDGLDQRKTVAQVIGQATTQEEHEILLDMFHQLKACEFILFGEPVQVPALSTVYFSLTNRCNLQCIHCCQDSGKASDGELTLEEVCQVIDNLCKWKVQKVIVTGGEPLMRSDFTDIINYLTTKGLQITLMTNGTLIDEETAQFIRQMIPRVNISLDGFNSETTDAIRGKGTFEKVIAAIHRLQRVGVTDLTLSMVLTQNNIRYKKDFAKLCQALQVNDQYRLFQPLGRGETHSAELDVDLSLFQADPEVIGAFREQINCKNLCGAGSKTLFINEKGDLYPCTLMNTSAQYMGNILRDTVWQDNGNYLRIQQELLQSVVDQIPECKDCDIRYFCVSGCPAIDRLRFFNDDLRRKECRFKKSFYQKVVWS